MIVGQDEDDVARPGSRHAREGLQFRRTARRRVTGPRDRRDGQERHRRHEEGSKRRIVAILVTPPRGSSRTLRMAGSSYERMTNVLNESAGRTGVIIRFPTSRRTGIGSLMSFWITTTTLPSALRKASWFS